MGAELNRQFSGASHDALATNNRGQEMTKFLAIFLLGVSMTTGANAVEVKVLSGGAVEPGLHAFAELVKRELGHD